MHAPANWKAIFEILCDVVIKNQLITCPVGIGHQPNRDSLTIA